MRTKVLLRGAGVALLVILGSLATLPQAHAANIDVTFSTQEVRGVRGTFGLSMHYAPSEAFVRPGSEVALGYAPGPLPATLIVDVIALLNSTGVNLPPAVAGIMDLLPGTFSVPLADTPVGRYTVGSVPIYGASGVSVTLDITLDGQVNASLTTDGGSLDRTVLQWTNWGGQEASLTAPNAGSVTVAASFAYYASNAYVVVFDIAGVAYEYEIASFPLGEFSSSQEAVSYIETVVPSPIDSATVPFLTGLAVVLLFGGLGTGVATGWWLRGRKALGVPQPSPPATRRAWKTKEQLQACGAVVILLGLLSLSVGLAEGSGFFGFLFLAFLLIGGFLLILGGLPIRWADEDRPSNGERLDRLLQAYLDGRISKEVFERNADAMGPPQPPRA